METRPNPVGLCEVSPLETSEKQFLIFPGHKIGSIQLLVIIEYMLIDIGKLFKIVIYRIFQIWNQVALVRQ